MPKRNLLLEKLAQYKKMNTDPSQQKLTEEIDLFVRNNKQCFERSLLHGHVTGSAWLLNKDQSKVCLTLHRKFNAWVQLGGHADGNHDLLEVALNEAREESGITDIAPVSTDIFDVDIHIVPEFKGVPEHKHYDIRFLLQVQSSESLMISNESIDLAWFSFNDPVFEQCNHSVKSLLHKWRKYICA